MEAGACGFVADEVGVAFWDVVGEFVLGASGAAVVLDPLGPDTATKVPIISTCLFPGLSWIDMVLVVAVGFFSSVFARVPSTTVMKGMLFVPCFESNRALGMVRSSDALGLETCTAIVSSSYVGFVSMLSTFTPLAL